MGVETGVSENEYARWKKRADQAEMIGTESGLDVWRSCRADEEYKGSWEERREEPIGNNPVVQAVVSYEVLQLPWGKDEP